MKNSKFLSEIKKKNKKDCLVLWDQKMHPKGPFSNCGRYLNSAKKIFISKTRALN